MLIFKGFEYYNSLKKRFDEKFMAEWTSMSGRPFVGGCSDIYQKYKPDTIEEFFRVYTEDYDKDYNFDTHKGNPKLGRSIEQFYDLSTLLYSKIKDKDSEITLEMCFDVIINYVLVSTFLGHMAERTIVNELRDKYLVEETDGDLDAVYGIDIIVRSKNDGKVISYIQVKPLSSFYHEKYRTRKWVKDYYEKQCKFNQKLISEGRKNELKEIKYIVYDYQYLVETGKVRFLCKGDRLRFSISELCDNNGTTLLTKDDLIFKTL